MTDAEKYGFLQSRCPKCRRVIWVEKDCRPECVCGWYPEPQMGICKSCEEALDDGEEGYCPACQAAHLSDAE